MNEERAIEIEERLKLLKQETARRKHDPQAVNTIDEVDSWGEDFIEGAFASVAKSALGLADLVGIGGEGSEQWLADLQLDAKDSWGGTVGNVVGEVGQIAGAIAGGPAAWGAGAAKVGKLASMLGKGGGGLSQAVNAAKGAGKVGASIAKETAKAVTPKAISSRLPTQASSLWKEAAAVGGLGAAQLPGANDTRLGNAAANVAMAAGGYGVMKGLGGLAKGMKITKEAEELMKRGVPLTADKATVSSLPKAAAAIMSVMPFTAKGVKVAHDKANKGFSKIVAEEVGDALGINLKTFSTAGMKQVDEAVDKGYKAAWSKVTKVNNAKIRQQLNDIVENSGHEAGTGTGFNQLKGILKNAEARLATGKGNAESVRQLDKAIKKAMKSGKTNGTLDELGDMLDVLRANVNPAAKASLETMDEAYKKALAYENVQAKVAIDGIEAATPRAILQAGATVGKFGKKHARGQAPLQDTATLGRETIGQKDPMIILDMIKGAVQSTPTNQALMDGASRAVMGKTNIQSTARKGLQNMEAIMLRSRNKMGTGYGALAAGLEQ